ncbi:hypothetical protein Hanom_Chr10g00909781 [Helianthus anomalus]
MPSLLESTRMHKYENHLKSKHPLALNRKNWPYIDISPIGAFQTNIT